MIAFAAVYPGMTGRSGLLGQGLCIKIERADGATSCLRNAPSTVACEDGPLARKLIMRGDAVG